MNWNAGLDDDGYEQLRSYHDELKRRVGSIWNRPVPEDQEDLGPFPDGDIDLDEAFDGIDRQTRVELLPDGRIVILAMDMAEVSVETDTHGKVTVTVEETDRDFYRKSYSLSVDKDRLTDLLLKKSRDA